MLTLAKWQACYKYHRHGRWFEGPRLLDADIETEAQDVYVMALYSDRAHGLDLSFVTHIFLLEPIHDAALLEQIVSRAHRLGATGPVTIETVHVWQPDFEVDDESPTGPADAPGLDIDLALQEGDDANGLGAGPGRGKTKKRVTRDICDRCYRSFPTKAEASEHELICERNPATRALAESDVGSLLSVYLEIRPPPPLVRNTNAE